MELSTCRECGRLFYNASDTPICPRCWKRSSEKIYELEEYLKENRGSDLYRTAEACHIEPEQIRQWLKEYRIEFPEDSVLEIPCEGCGKMIHSGKLCITCREKKRTLIRGLADEMRESGEKPPKDTKPKQNPKDVFYLWEKW